VQYQPVFQTTVIHNNCNPKWPPQELALGSICGGDLQSSLLFRVRSLLVLFWELYSVRPKKRIHFSRSHFCIPLLEVLLEVQ
jgi:hypothetical protein